MGLHDLHVNRFRDIKRLANLLTWHLRGRCGLRIADDMRESAPARTTQNENSTTVRPYAREIPAWNEKILFDILASRAREYPRNAASDLRLERI